MVNVSVSEGTSERLAHLNEVAYGTVVGGGLGELLLVLPKGFAARYHDLLEGRLDGERGHCRARINEVSRDIPGRHLGLPCTTGRV